MKALEFLQVSEPTFKEAFLIHISKLIQIELNVDDNYLHLFGKLKDYSNKHLTDDEDKKAIIDFIEHNENQLEPEQFLQVITEDSGMYAVFNLFTIRS